MDTYEVKAIKKSIPTVRIKKRFCKNAVLDTEERNASRVKGTPRRMPRSPDLIGKLIYVH